MDKHMAREMTPHTMKRLYTGRNEDRTIQPSCSCGWVGEPIPAWNDYQMTIVKDQERAHYGEVRRQVSP